MTRTSPTAGHDVFLTFAAADAAVGGAVHRQLEAAGLTVVPSDRIGAGVELSEGVLRQITTSATFAVILTPSSLHNGNLALELGVAWGAAVPVYVLTSGVPTADVPAYLAKYRVGELWGGLPRIVDEIRLSAQPLTDDQTQTLLDTFKRLGATVDDLQRDFSARVRLAEDFAGETGLTLKPDRLVRELLRLRKAKRLPKLTARSAG